MDMDRSYSGSSSSSASSAPSPAMPASMLRRHPASLIPKFQHDPALVELMRSAVTKDMICTLLVRWLQGQVAYPFPQPISPHKQCRSFNAAQHPQTRCHRRQQRQQKALSLLQRHQFRPTQSFLAWRRLSRSLSRRAMCKCQHYFARSSF